MGQIIHLRKIELLFDKSQVVDFRSIKNIVGSSYAKLLVSNLLKKKKIFKIGKGIYTKHNENGLAVFSYQPAYLGLQSALSYYGLWEQETNPVILTTRKVRLGIRDVNGGNILIRNLSKKFYFGFDYVNDSGFYLPYSNIEKTLIDLVVYNQYLDRRMLMQFKKKINLNKLKKYLKVYDQRVKEKIFCLLKIK